MPEDAPLGGAVDLSGFLKFDRDLAKHLGQDNHRKCQIEGRVQHDQRPDGIDQMQFANDEEVGSHKDDGGQHPLRQKPGRQASIARTLEPKPGDAVRCQGPQHERHSRRANRDDRAVDKGLLDFPFIPKHAPRIERRLELQPWDPFVAVIVLGVLERVHERPVEREQGPNQNECDHDANEHVASQLAPLGSLLHVLSSDGCPQRFHICAHGCLTSPSS